LCSLIIMRQQETTAEEIKILFGSYHAILRMVTHHTKNAERNMRTACESIVKLVQQIKILRMVTHHTKNAERNVRTACESMVKLVQQIRILNYF
jgi:hypothetical protein